MQGRQGDTMQKAGGRCRKSKETFHEKQGDTTQKARQRFVKNKAMLRGKHGNAPRKTRRHYAETRATEAEIPRLGNGKSALGSGESCRDAGG